MEGKYNTAAGRLEINQRAIKDENQERTNSVFHLGGRLLKEQLHRGQSLCRDISAEVKKVCPVASVNHEQWRSPGEREVVGGRSHSVGDLSLPSRECASSSPQIYSILLAIVCMS